MVIILIIEFWADVAALTNGKSTMATLMMTNTSRPPLPVPPHAPKAQDAREAADTPTVRLNTGDLFNGAREIVIDHNGREYRLRITQQGKLLLTA